MLRALARHLAPPAAEAAPRRAPAPAAAADGRDTTDDPYTPQEYVGGGGYTREGRRRVCFTLQFAPGKVEEYLETHLHVWPELQQLCADSGIHNQSLFMRPDGFVCAYCEVDDTLQACFDRMDADASGVNARW